MYFSQFEARIIFHVVLDSFYFLLSAHSLSLHLFYFQHVQLHIFVLSIQTIQTKILRYTAQNESQNSICRKSDLRFIKKTKRNTHKSKINHVNLLHLQQSAAVCRLEKKKLKLKWNFSFVSAPFTMFQINVIYIVRCLWEINNERVFDSFRSLSPRWFMFQKFYLYFFWFFHCFRWDYRSHWMRFCFEFR